MSTLTAQPVVCCRSRHGEVVARIEELQVVKENESCRCRNVRSNCNCAGTRLQSDPRVRSSRLFLLWRPPGILYVSRMAVLRRGAMIVFHDAEQIVAAGRNQKLRAGILTESVMTAMHNEASLLPCRKT